VAYLSKLTVSEFFDEAKILSRKFHHRRMEFFHLHDSVGIKVLLRFSLESGR